MKEYIRPSGIDREQNALLTFLLAAYLLLNCVKILNDGNLTWTAYGLSVLLLVFLPPLRLRDYSAMVPFEILLFLAVPFTLKGLEIGFVASHTVNYLSASGIALLVVAELDSYTSFSTTPRFTVWIVALTTIAVAGFWAVGRWISHLYFGTGFQVSENLLMWEFAASAIAGVFSGIIFTAYFRRVIDR